MNNDALLRFCLLFSFISILIYYVFGGGIGQAFIFFSTFLLFLNTFKLYFKLSSILFVGIFFLLFLISSFFSRSYPYYYSVAILFYGVFSLIFANLFIEVNSKSKFSLYFYYIFILFLWFNFLKLGFFNPDAYNDIFNNASRNVVSAFLLFLTMFVGASYWVDNKKQPLLIYSITLLSSLMLFGRTGIVISFILFLYAFYDVYGRKIFWFMILIPIFLFLYMKYGNMLEVFLMEETSFKYGLESPRKLMLNEYVNGILYSERNLFFGRNYYECCNTVIQYNINPHNSFIVGHARYGLLHTIFFISLFIYSLKYLVRKSVLVFFIALIYFRFMFDQLGIFSPLDFILFYLFLLIFSDLSEIKK